MSFKTVCRENMSNVFVFHCSLFSRITRSQRHRRYFRTRVTGTPRTSGTSSKYTLYFYNIYYRVSLINLLSFYAGSRIKNLHSTGYCVNYRHFMCYRLGGILKYLLINSNISAWSYVSSLKSKTSCYNNIMIKLSIIWFYIETWLC